jgi:hypothetical protein
MVRRRHPVQPRIAVEHQGNAREGIRVGQGLGRQRGHHRQALRVVLAGHVGHVLVRHHRDRAALQAHDPVPVDQEYPAGVVAVARHEGREVVADLGVRLGRLGPVRLAGLQGLVERDPPTFEILPVHGLGGLGPVEGDRDEQVLAQGDRGDVRALAHALLPRPNGHLLQGGPRPDLGPQIGPDRLEVLGQ